MKKRQFIFALLTFLLLTAVLAACSVSGKDSDNTPASPDVTQDANTPENTTSPDLSQAVEINSADGVGVVTQIEGTVITYRLYSSPNSQKITDYSKIDPSEYTSTDATPYVDVADCLINEYSNGEWHERTVSDISPGDWIVITYDLDTQELVGLIILPSQVD